MPDFLSVPNKIAVCFLIMPQGLFAFSTKQPSYANKALIYLSM